MTRPPKFEINLAEQFPTLHHAPIVEAVIQFNAPSSTVIDSPQLKKTLLERFSEHALSDQVQLEAGFTGSPGGMKVHHKSQWDGFRLSSQDEKYVCQWKRSCLSVSRLAPYEDWETFQAAFLPFWEAYREIHSPDLIESIGVRFISQIELTVNDRISDFVVKVPPPLKGLGLQSDSFFHQDTIPLKGYPYEIRLIRAMQRAAESSGDKSTLIVDIDVATTEATAFGDLETTLEEMRFLKNRVFFTYMKNAETKFK